MPISMGPMCPPLVDVLIVSFHCVWEFGACAQYAFRVKVLEMRSASISKLSASLSKSAELLQFAEEGEQMFS